MKKPVVSIALCLLIIGCSGKKDILATYNGGSVTRGELYEHLKDKQLSIGYFEKKRIFQKKELEMIAVDRIAALEARKNGYDKSERFTFLLNDIRNRYLGAFLIDDIIDKGGFSEKAVFVRNIVFKVPEDSPAGINKTLSKAREIIAQLDKGKDFRDLAAQYSEDISKSKGGEVGYILQGMFPDEYWRAAFALNKGGYTKEPVLLKNRKRVFIIKAENIVQLDQSNFDDIITDKKMAINYKKLIFQRKREAFINELKSAGDVEFRQGMVTSGNPSSVIFSIGGKNYTVSDINTRMEMIREASFIKDNHIPPDFKKRIIDSYFISELLAREAQQRGIDRTEEFIRKMKSAKETYLAGDYMEHMSMQDIPITEEEIRKEYERGKNERYAHPATGGTKTMHPRPYHEVRDMARRAVWNMKALKKRALWIERMLKEYRFEIHESELAGD